MKTILALMMSTVLFTSFNVTANTDTATEEIAAADENTDLTLTEQNYDEAFLSTITGWIKKGWEKVKGLFGKKGISEEKCPALLGQFPTKSAFVEAAQGMTTEQVNTGLICYE